MGICVGVYSSEEMTPYPREHPKRLVLKVKELLLLFYIF